MAKLYTLEELDQANLPGFITPATLETSLKQGTDWQTVLSLTILSHDNGELKVLDGIRRDDANATHPNVVSTPTGRIPRILARTMLADANNLRPVGAKWELGEVNPAKPLIVEQLEADIKTIPDHETTLTYAVGSLLASKLGVAAPLELSTHERPFAATSLATILGGFSYASNRYEDGEEIPLYEPLVMMGAVVTVDNPDDVPATTESYRNMSWVPLDQYLDGVRNRKPGLLIENITVDDEVSVCVRGLCLATSASNLADTTFLAQHVAS